MYLQGHPEYDAVSLLKEYKRELALWFDGTLEALPPYPANYFTPAATRIVGAHVEAMWAARVRGARPAAVPRGRV